MKKAALFRISSLLAAGLIPGKSLAAIGSAADGNVKDQRLFDIFKRNQQLIISGHRSHSSHSSHRSHRSSTGGGYSAPRLYTPPPVIRPPRTVPTKPVVPSTPKSPAPPNAWRSDSTPPTSILPAPQRVAPKPSSSQALVPKEMAEKFKQRVRVVQLGLFSYGYLSGEIDGIMGPQTRVAISKFQTDFNLKVTGTITPELLKALGVHAQ